MAGVEFGEGEQEERPRPEVGVLGRVEEHERLAGIPRRSAVVVLLRVQSRLCPVDLGECERIAALHLGDDPGQELGRLRERRHLRQRVREQDGEAEPSRWIILLLRPRQRPPEERDRGLRLPGSEVGATQRVQGSLIP